MAEMASMEDVDSKANEVMLVTLVRKDYEVNLESMALTVSKVEMDVLVLLESRV